MIITKFNILVTIQVRVSLDIDLIFHVLLWRCIITCEYQRLIVNEFFYYMVRNIYATIISRIDV